MKRDEYGFAAPPENLYAYRAVISSGIAGFDNVAEADIAAFHALGFLVVHDAFDRGSIESARAGLSQLILRPGADNIMLEAAAGASFEKGTEAARLDSVRKLMPILPFDRRLRALAEQADLLALLERILGEAPMLSQDMALLKPPRIGREKPWHQDMAYFDYPSETTIVGVWIALDAAFPENGCMMIIPGSHRDGPMPHWTRRDWQICDTDVTVGDSVAVPLPPGGCLLFHCLLHHGTPPSRSDKRRWALQFHYRPSSVTPLPTSEHRLRVFGADGADASC